MKAPSEEICGKSTLRSWCWKVYILWATTPSLTIRINLHSFSCSCLSNLRRKVAFIAVIGHHKSSILVPIESAHMQLPIVINSDLDVSPTVFEIFDAFGSKIACFAHPTLVWRPVVQQRPAIIYTPLKSTFNGLQLCCWQLRTCNGAEYQVKIFLSMPIYAFHGAILGVFLLVVNGYAVYCYLNGVHNYLHRWKN